MTGRDNDDDRTRFMPLPGAAPPDGDDTPPAAAPAPPARAPSGPGSPAAPADEERTRFIAPPEPTKTQAPPRPLGLPREVRPNPHPPAPDFDHPDDQPTSTGAFPDAERTDVAPPPAVAQPRGPAGAGSPAQIGIGTIINNNYRIEEVLKSGGMGSVYRGVNIHTEDPVAIKVILPELAEDEKVGLMFKREARTLGQLQDDAIVRYYNYVFDPDLGGYCLVMAFISGVPLSDQTTVEGPISVADGIVLLRRLAKGLQKAHDQEVIHRDLSPDNVMLPHGSVAEAVLIDFGIAKSNVVKEGTMAGQFAGKFKFVAPEQLGHYGGEIGPRADIYSLALLMSAATVGKPLDMGASIVEAVQSRQSIPDVSEVPQDLRPIIAHMLEPDPGYRPASMAEVVELLDQPERIPLKYREGQPLPDTTRTGVGTTTRTYSTANQSVQGLQAPPSGVNVGATATGDLPAQDRDGMAWLFPLIAVLALAGVAGGLYYAVGDDLLGREAEVTEEATPREGGLAPRASNTREGFLAEFDAGECSYATRISTGADAGMIAGFAPDAATFADLPAAYEDRFGSRPDISGRVVTDAQCAALDFARALQGTTLEPVEMVLDARSVESGDVFSGRITDRDNRRMWLALVSPGGGVFNLTPRLSDPVGGVRTFSFGLNLAAGAEAAPQIILAVASVDPLVRTAASRDGAVAAGLLPLIRREIESKDGAAVAALGQVMLTAKGEAPAPAPEPDMPALDEAPPGAEAGE